MKPQDRRSINVSTPIHEELSLLQAQIRMKMKGTDYLLGKTAMTVILETLIKTANVDELVKLLK